MPVPVSWDDIYPNPVQNSPQGSEPLGTQADDYIRQAFAFCKQLHDGWIAADGSVAATADLDMGGFVFKNSGAPVDTGDLVNKAYADNLFNNNFPRGSIILWFGDVTKKPAAWLVCDGTNGTPDMRNKFAIGAGDQTANGVLGGSSFPVISAAQMPSHAHGINDPGHAHSVYDPSHAHGVADPGHAHAQPNLGSVQAGADNGGVGCAVQNTYGTGRGQGPVSPSGTGIGIYGAATGIGIYGSGTGVSIQAAGGNAAFDNRPAFVGLHYLMKS
jgi:hypothetical protein